MGGTAFNRLTSDFITPARALGPSGKRAELIKQSSERDRGVDDTDPQNVDHKLRSERQDDSLDHRVTQLVSTFLQTPSCGRTTDSFLSFFFLENKQITSWKLIKHFSSSVKAWSHSS